MIDTNLSVVGTPSEAPRVAIERWGIAGGSVPGAEHRRSDRPNQDALAWRCSEECLVAAVADGCGSGAHSELGARLGAHLWVSAALARAGRGRPLADAGIWGAIADDVLARLGELVPLLGQDPRKAIGEHLLFTLVAAVLTPTEIAIVAIGDGLVMVDDQVHRLGPFPDNRPPYVGYGLLPGRARPETRIIHVGSASRVERVLLGTDGALDLHERASLPVPGTPEPVGELAQFVEPGCFRHADALRRRLARIQREHVEVCWDEERIVRSRGVLPDDTTLIALRREVER